MPALFGENKNRVHNKCHSDSAAGLLPVLQRVDLVIRNLDFRNFFFVRFLVRYKGKNLFILCGRFPFSALFKRAYRTPNVLCLVAAQSSESGFGAQGQQHEYSDEFFLRHFSPELSYSEDGTSLSPLSGLKRPFRDTEANFCREPLR